MTLQIDTLAYTNRLRWLAPEQKLLFVITLLILTAFSRPPLQILIAIWISNWTVLYAKIPLRIYLKLVYIAILFWLTSLPALVINGINIQHLNLIQDDSIIGLNVASYYIYISHHGIEQGWTILARAIASLSCLYFVMLTIPFTEILQTLGRFGFPVLLRDILLLMYRFIFVLLNTASEIFTAQQSRGGYCTLRIGIKSLSLLIGQLLSRTLENYHQVSLSLASRGFNGEFKVWYPHRYHFSKRYAIEAIIGCVVLIKLSWG
ncbi:cobalt ECF transporter T component CbiQ [Umezakia ovalisporum]|uniref:Cobalt ECF transporter T component CbiQ n=2 Tax=Umezakia ovalisporum TaxID=75695 RepID=A0AA43KDE3_9CYAN|nr:cobalt ECF transporter T component CbiQ [Umezakia ovalisporum]MDH6057320.1 cobalt ECF transporter T component CbiQ [Umezakia ovalisporum FSS-43]MDH6062396.1 cobalt ECF transporter T component CbiQ [Umezakia ovalisporum FSS-62]MDH6072742.1 cobalt ECF transporter T component CbiQ [Umezakia ovalisporum CobakiLakeA]MDH6075605.1 cobalt ECF transporter T component CbiQ [Umezakia ovalisporum CS-1034]MDH6079634.1 cobalt ECF transporter T component CbiQ [Umezakia ovalisporum FSS-45]